MTFIYIAYFLLPFFTIMFLYSILGDTKFKDDGNYIGAFLICAITSVFISGLVFTVYSNVKISNMEKEEKIVYNYNLTSLNSSQDINGSYSNMFFVGSGYINETLYYHFFYETKKGIIYTKQRANDVYIIETEEDPKFVIYGMYLSDTSNVFYNNKLLHKSRKVLYIPKGTIKRNYKVN